MNIFINSKLKNTRLKAMFTTTTILVAMLFSANSVAGGKHHSATAWAKVTRVEAITRTVERRIPERDCWNEQVQYEEYYDADRSYTGTIVGSIIGGALGNAVGHRKKNKKIGTAVGAILGATVGNDIASKNGRQIKPTTRYRDERRCEVSHHTRYEEEVVGYHVWYRYHGEKYKTRMHHKPGKRIKVRVVVEPL